jgi:RNA polymerase sigma factor (sigma-70 family)
VEHDRHRSGDVDHDGHRSGAETLADEAARGRRADRELALRLGHPAPDLPAPRPHRAAPPGELDRALVEAAKEGDEHALAEVVHAHLPLIERMARGYAASPHVERLELVQEGVAALLQALDRYDPSRGTPLWAYARPAVQRAMLRLLGELGDAATLPERGLRRLSQLKSAEEELWRERGRMPMRAEVVERSGVDRDRAEQVLSATRLPRSFQEPITAEDGGVIGTIGALVSDPRAQDAYERVLDEVEAGELLPLLSALSERERVVLRARYGLDGEPASRRQVARRLGVSESRVRDIERRALAKLRRAAARAGAAR